MGRTAALLGFAALSAPAAASGELIYAAPDGNAFFCSQSQPCGIGIAINLKAQSGDEVLLAPGTYETSAHLEFPSGVTGVTIRPRDPGTRPVIASTAVIALQLSSGSAARGIELQHDNPGATGIFAIGNNSRIANVIATSNGDAACQISGARINDSICHATGPDGRALRMSLSGGVAAGKVRNATLISDGPDGVGIYANGTGAGTAVTLDVGSSIVNGDVTDIVADTDGVGTATVTVAASNFDSRGQDVNGTVTAPTAAGNQTTPPIFTGPTFEQAPGSPTIDTGLLDADTGTSDVYGDARPQGAANDIGADELAVAAPPAAADTTPPETTITKAPKRKSKKRKATLAFASSEPGSTFECKLDKGGFEACGTSLQLKRLKRRRHTLQVRAIDAAGNVDATPASARWKVKRKR